MRHDLFVNHCNDGTIVHKRSKALECGTAFGVIEDNRPRNLALEALWHEYGLIEEVFEHRELARHHMP